MTVIAVPAHIPAFQRMESTPARARTFATNLRAVTVGVKDVQGWAGGIAAPDWEGDTAQSHDHAATRFARRLDSAEAALDRAVTAADRFEERLTRLLAQRTPIETERKAVNADAEVLRGDIEAARGGDVTEEQLAALERRGERLTARATAVTDDITDWVTRYHDAEADFIAALARVDSVSEGRDAAADPGRVDVDALADQLRRHRDDPAALNDWWLGLSRAQRQALTTEHPHLVGNADGIPVRDRDEANRAALYSDIDHLTQREQDGQLTAAERSVLENARHVREALDDYRNAVDPATGRELAHVVVYQPGLHSGDGGVAISFGDPDTADHVSVNVPGLTSETSSTSGNLESTYALHEAALREGNGSVASIYWLDYDAPSGDLLNPFAPFEKVDFGGVALPLKADAGGERFGDFIDGLRASDEGARAHLTAIGHSYGSTTVGHALQDGLAVDDAIVIGSPGQPVATADALTDADVWVGSRDHDPVTLLGFGDRGGIGALGHDPADDDFGGRRFETGDGSLRVEDLIDNHTSYFEGESLDNMAHIVADRDDRVTDQPARGEPGGHYLTLDELIAVSSGASAGEFVWDHGGEWLYERGKDGVEFGEWLLENSRFGGILGR
ncbi:alpha/beta hydrolase [Nocardioides sp. SYSU DS0651]|uniref:alpha/beta hydrolase n=1 Tax=Nocardioides sp. SYSU DS0651 TaxID=3415955 RepID=UPI003F4B3AB7